MNASPLETGAFDPEALRSACAGLRRADGLGRLAVSDGVWELVATFGGAQGVRVTATRTLPTLRGRLLRRGAVTAAAMTAVGRRLAADPALREPQALTDAGVSSDLIADGTRLALAEALVGATFWVGATYALRSGSSAAPPVLEGDGSTLELDGSAEGLFEAVERELEAAEAARAQQEDLAFWLEVTDAGAEAVERREPLGKGRDRRDRERLLGFLVRARRAHAGAASGRTGLSEVELVRASADLVERGYAAVDREGAAPKPPAGEPRLAPIPWRLAAAAHALRGRAPAPAGRHLARAASLMLAAGATQRAARFASEAAAAAPDDLEALLVAVETAWSVGAAERAAQLSGPLASRLLALGLPRRAHAVAARALERGESAELREVAYRALERVGDAEGSSQAGRAWVSALRDEGREEAARQAAGLLLEGSSAAEREQVLRAAGIDRRKVVALLGVGALIAALHVPARARSESRAAYRDAVEAAHSALVTAPSLSAATSTLDGLARQLETLAQTAEGSLFGAGDVAARAREVAEHVDGVRTDGLAAHSLLPHLPWREASDFEYLERQVAGLARRARTPALSGPMAVLSKEMRAFREAAEADRDRLAMQRPSQASLALARKMVATYQAMRGLLADATMAVRIETTPPGAAVRFGGVPFAQRTPLTLRMPVAGEPQPLVLHLAGHEPVERPLSLAAFGDAPVLVVSLTPTGRTTRPVVNGGAPIEDRRPNDVEPPPPAVDEPRRPAAPPPQVEFVDGQVAGRKPRDLAFAPSPRRFASMRLKATLRARVLAQNVIEGRKVFLRGFQVVLYLRGRGRWIAQPAESFQLEERLERPVALLAGGRGRQVQELDRTHGLDGRTLDGLVREALKKAMRRLLEREQRSR